MNTSQGELRFSTPHHRSTCRRLLRTRSRDLIPTPSGPWPGTRSSCSDGPPPTHRAARIAPPRSTGSRPPDSGKMPTTSVRRRISRFSRSLGCFEKGALHVPETQLRGTPNCLVGRVTESSRPLQTRTAHCYYPTPLRGRKVGETRSASLRGGLRTEMEASTREGRRPALRGRAEGRPARFLRAGASSSPVPPWPHRLHGWRRGTSRRGRGCMRRSRTLTWSATSTTGY